MTVSALESVIDKAADAGMNTIVMEWEATFPFDRHAVLRNRYAYTEREVRDLIAYARRRNIDIIPLQNCFGHCEYILRHDRYAALREDKREVSQVCPSRIGEAETVFREIFAEIAAMHPSPYIHIGGDETRLLGHCKQCRQKVEAQGASALFVDYIKAMCRIVAELGKTP
ncbi:MAG: family 20 glycosylhydrolase, partial [Alistipes sp.]|nr:family 20 glycosylhydrolase [Alistipes sp.]